MRVQDYSLDTFNYRLHKRLGKAILLLSMECRRFLDDTCFFKVLSCYIKVKFIKVSVKDVNPNTVLSIDKNNKIMKGRKSI